MPCSCKAGNACVSIYSLTFTNLHALWIIWVCCVLTEEGNSFSLGLNLLSSAVIMKSDPHPPTTTFCVHPPEGQHWNWYMQLHMAGLGNGWMRNKRVKSRGIIIIIINSQLKSAFYSYVNTWFKSFFFFFPFFFFSLGIHILKCVFLNCWGFEESCLKSGCLCLEMKNMHAGSKYDPASVKVQLLVVAGGDVPCIPGSIWLYEEQMELRADGPGPKSRLAKESLCSAVIPHAYMHSCQ